MMPVSPRARPAAAEEVAAAEEEVAAAEEARTPEHIPRHNIVTSVREESRARPMAVRVPRQIFDVNGGVRLIHANPTRARGAR